MLRQPARAHRSDPPQRSHYFSNFLFHIFNKFTLHAIIVVITLAPVNSLSLMRFQFNPQPELDVLPIEKILIPQASRDELPPVLAGLQWIWTHPTLRTEILALLTRKILADKKATGRTGMALWQILVLGVVRLALDADWDRLAYLANYDVLLRQMLGVSTFPLTGEADPFHRRTMRDNVALLDAELLTQINALVAVAGRQEFEPKGKLQVRADSYVVETDVHFPTDFNLLWDSGRKCLDMIEKLIFKGMNLPGWRKVRDWRKRIKAAERSSSRASSGGGKYKDQRVKELTENYLNIARELAAKLEADRPLIQAQCQDEGAVVLIVQLDYFFQMLEKHIDLLERRVMRGEDIPTAEKIYSIFEGHTEWINKGKLHRGVELGHRNLIATDEFQLIVDYRTPSGPDSQESIGVADRLLARFGDDAIESLSFDKGFTDAGDKELIQLYIPRVVMPKRGRKTVAQAAEESERTFAKLRRAHSAVESAINALEHHGLNRCLDVGMEGFERYVGYGVLAYNLHLIGRQLQRKTETEEQRQAA